MQKGMGATTTPVRWAGHNRWSQVKRDKAVHDQRRSQAFTKVAKEIVAAVKGTLSSVPRSVLILGAHPATAFIRPRSAFIRPRSAFIRPRSAFIRASSVFIRPVLISDPALLFHSRAFLRSTSRWAGPVGQQRARVRAAQG